MILRGWSKAAGLAEMRVGPRRGAGEGAGDRAPMPDPNAVCSVRREPGRVYTSKLLYEHAQPLLCRALKSAPHSKQGKQTWRLEPSRAKDTRGPSDKDRQLLPRGSYAAIRGGCVAAREPPLALHPARCTGELSRGDRKARAQGLSLRPSQTWGTRGSEPWQEEPLCPQPGAPGGRGRRLAAWRRGFCRAWSAGRLTEKGFVLPGQWSNGQWQPGKQRGKGQLWGEPRREGGAVQRCPASGALPRGGKPGAAGTVGQQEAEVLSPGERACCSNGDQGGLASGTFKRRAGDRS